MAKKKVERPAPSREQIAQKLADLAIAKKVVKTLEQDLQAAYREYGDICGAGFYVDCRQTVSEELYKPDALLWAIEKFCQNDPGMLLLYIKHFLSEIPPSSYKGITIRLPNHGDLASLCDNWDVSGGKSRLRGEALVSVRTTAPEPEALVPFGDEPLPKGWEEAGRGDYEEPEDSEYMPAMTPGD